ncbi:MAG: hypothetical protein Q7N50_13355 [Armatimonadota bacterium]|nr:hypothetical protein [Armatimonadota bacterium]
MIHRIITITVLFIALVSISISARSASNRSPSDNRTTTAGLPVQLLVVPLDEWGTANFALTYPMHIPTEEAQKDVAEIAARAYWRISNIEVTNSAETSSEKAEMTSVGFVAEYAVPARSGFLPVEPLIVALKRFDSVSLIFAMRPEFQFRGLTDFENEFVKINFGVNGASYTYNVRIKRHNFDKLGLPTAPPPQGQPAPRAGKSGSLFWPLLLSLIIGAGVWFYAYMTGKRRKANRE